MQTGPAAEVTRGCGQDTARCPIPGPPLQACPAGGSVAPNAEGRTRPRRPGQGHRDKLGSRTAKFKPAESGEAFPEEVRMAQRKARAF